MTVFPPLNKTLSQLLGPSIVFVALSLNGGEMLLWPDLIGRYGITLLWLVPIILILQFFTNLEIERYSLTIGKSTLRGLIDQNKFLGWLFILGIVVSLMWPAWVSIAGNMLAVLLGLDFKIYGGWLASILLLLLLLLWFSSKSYHLLEQITKVGLFVALIIGFTVLFRLFNLNQLQNSLQNPVWIVDGKSDSITFLSALAFGGVSGVLNLVQSDWVMNKKYGIASLEKGTPVDWNKQESKTNWQKWWNLIVKEHFILFYLGNIFGIFLISLIGFFTLTGKNLKGFSLLNFQVNFLNQEFVFAGYLWGIGIFILFIMAQITILDTAGRLLKHSLEYFPILNSLNKLNHSRLSQLFGLIGFIILLIGAINPGFNQPSGLLETSASLSALIMSIYPLLLLKINLKLPIQTRPKKLNQIMIVLCSLFYGCMCLWVLYSLVL